MRDEPQWKQPLPSQETSTAIRPPQSLSMTFEAGSWVEKTPNSFTWAPASNPAQPDSGDATATSQREPTYFVGTERILTTLDVPGFRSADTRGMELGTLILNDAGNVWRLQCRPGLLQREWIPVGSILPKDWELDPVSVSHDVAHASRRGYVSVLSINLSLLAHAVLDWLDTDRDLDDRVSLHEEFFEELAIQLHRPAPTRRARMKVVKTATQRGRVGHSNVDPLTPWALRAAGEKLVGDIAEDAEHQVDHINVKRLRHLSQRHVELQAQLDEVAGQLQAAQALLLSQPVGA